METCGSKNLQEEGSASLIFGRLLDHDIETQIDGSQISSRDAIVDELHVPKGEKESLELNFHAKIVEDKPHWNVNSEDKQDHEDLMDSDEQIAIGSTLNSTRNDEPKTQVQNGLKDFKFEHVYESQGYDHQSTEGRSGIRIDEKVKTQDPGTKCEYKAEEYDDSGDECLIEGFPGADTQVINNGSDLDGTQVLKMHTFNDTQIISPLIRGKQYLKLDERLSMDETGFDGANKIQIPNTVEKPGASCTQVVNTQDIDKNKKPSKIFEGTVSSSDGAIYSSQKLQGVEIIETDEETEEYEEFYDDSVLIQKFNLKKRKKMEEDQRSVSEVLSSQELDRITLKIPSLSDKFNSPVSNNGQPEHQNTSPFIVDESSPAIKNCDLLKKNQTLSPFGITASHRNSDGRRDSRASQKNIQIRSSSPLAKGPKSNTVNIDKKISHSKNSATIPPERASLLELKERNEEEDISRNVGLRCRISSKETDQCPGPNSEIPRVMNDVFLTKEELSELSEKDVVCSNSVWALSKFKLYSGRLNKWGPEFLLIDFEEGSYLTRNEDIYMLDIRIGDIINIKSSRHKFTVVGLKLQRGEASICCMRGYNYAILQRIAKNKVFKKIQVRIADCYMELPEWIQHQQKFGLLVSEVDREAKVGANKPTSATLNRTPTRKNTRCSSYDRSNPTSSPLRKRNILLDLNDAQIKSGIFSGMIFCPTFGKNFEDVEREELNVLIKNNGGVVLEGGLRTVFEYDRTDDERLSIKSDILGQYIFGAVLSNNYCRSAKYLEGLALGWPILSVTFITDCIRDEKRLLDWPAYLLPAGYSSILKCVKSLDIFGFRKNYEQNRKLSQQIFNNSHILKDYSIFVVGTFDEETFELCKFIFHTFGAKSLDICYTMEEMLRKIGNSLDTPCLIYDHDNSVVKGMESFLTHLRNRADHRNALEEQENLQREQVSIIDWEWIVQSTISGCALRVKELRIPNIDI